MEGQEGRTPGSFFLIFNLKIPLIAEEIWFQYVEIFLHSQKQWKYVPLSDSEKEWLISCRIRMGSVNYFILHLLRLICYM